MDPIKSFLKSGALPIDKKQAIKVKIIDNYFYMINDILYYHGFYGPYLRCLAPTEANYVLVEIYERIFSNHLGVRNLPYKVPRQGYY